MTDDALRLTNVTKKFGDFTAVDDVSLTVPTGSIYGFLGPNGAGKTTTIRMILDIFKPTTGTIAVLGKPSAMDVRGRIGYLPEEKGLYKKMKAWATVAYFAALKGVDRKTAKTRAFELLERYGLKDFANSRIEELSKGMGQKVQVLASVSHDPDFVVLDEPFSGLDPSNQEVMEDVIRDMSSRECTVVFSTHVMSHAERICDRVVLIAKGQKVFDGTIPEARRVLEKTVRLQTRQDVGQLRSVSGVIDIRRVDGPFEVEAGAHSHLDAVDAGAGGPFHEIVLNEDASHDDVMRACFDLGIALHSFDYKTPTLHDVFIELVGDDAKEAALR